MKNTFESISDLDGYDDMNEDDQARLQTAWDSGHVADEDVPESARKPEGEEEEKPKKKAAPRKKKADADEDGDAEEKPKKKAAPRKKKAETEEDGDEAEEKPKKKAAPRKKAVKVGSRSPHHRQTC
jgi:hypothetical protein